MTPLDFLNETLINVNNALSETLRHDYGPDRSKLFYDECKNRLDEVRQEIASLSPIDANGIADQLSALSTLGMWISFIERSHLGEFSWPFADHISEIARALLSEVDLNGDIVEPIIQIVADSGGYSITNEETPPFSARKRFAAVVFPKHMKYDVLFHVIFGHELGHTAFYTKKTGMRVENEVLFPLIKSSVMENEKDMLAWLKNDLAPIEVKAMLAAHVDLSGSPFEFDLASKLSWWMEFVCDLFGLVLYGPSFIAAHKALILSTDPAVYTFSTDDVTHPPYAVRHKMLVKANRLLQWDQPVTLEKDDGVFYQAEEQFCHYVDEDQYLLWADVFPDANLKIATDGIKAILGPLGLDFQRLSRESLIEMTQRIGSGLPPLLDGLDGDGKPQLRPTPFSQIINAGWVYWLGRSYIPNKGPITFNDANRLCHQALVQQTAIAKKLK